MYLKTFSHMYEKKVDKTLTQSIFFKANVVIFSEYILTFFMEIALGSLVRTNIC